MFDRRAVVFSMWTDGLTEMRRTPPPIEFRRVVIDEHLATFATINNIAQEFDADAGLTIYASRSRKRRARGTYRGSGRHGNH